MPIETPQLTDAEVEAIRARVGELGARPEYAGREIARARRDALAVAIPHDVYTLSLEAIATGAGLDVAEPIGRRCLVLAGEHPIATAELAAAGSTTGGQVTLTEGPFTEATVKAVAAAEALPQIADGDHELRLLRIPALYLMAIWLEGPAAHQRLLIPLEPVPAGLEAGVPRSETELLNLLRGPAAQILQSDLGE